VRRIARNQIYLLARHYPAKVCARWFWPILCAHVLWGVVATRHGGGLAWLTGVVQGLSGFTRMRTDIAITDSQVLESLLRSGEQTIHDLQASTGYDIYWRMYFLLTAGGA